MTIQELDQKIKEINTRLDMLCELENTSLNLEIITRLEHELADMENERQQLVYDLSPPCPVVDLAEYRQKKKEQLNKRVS